MIKKRYILIPLFVLGIGLLTIAALGYFLVSSMSDDDEVVYAATEVGTPVGDKVTKNIGSAGGTIASPDGRLTLTVPQGALTETVAFSIQPVTNTFGGGLGLAYKLGPDTKAFAVPLELSLHYDENDLEGSFPEALSFGYQDDKGAWHVQKAVDLDKDAETIAVMTTHFSVWSTTSTLKVSPAKATVRIGEQVHLSLTDCQEEGIGKAIDKFLVLIGDERPCLPGVWDVKVDLVGEGRVTPGNFDLIYTAPGKKPTPNVATVVIYRKEFMVWAPEPCTYEEVPLKGKNSKGVTIRKHCGKYVLGPQTVRAVITIVDQGYRASGQDGPTSYSGVVCNLDKPFTITGQTALVALPFKFVPSSGTAGTMSYSSTYKVLTMAGTATYTIEGADTETPRILAQTKSTLTGMGRTTSGGGPAHIDLTPLTSNECGDQPMHHIHGF